MSGAWSKALAASVALLGHGYLVAGLLWSLNRVGPNVVCLGMVGVGVSLAAIAARVLRGSGRAKAAATVAGFVGTVVLGTLMLSASFERDPEATEAANNVSAATAVGLAALSALVLAMGVTLAVVETKAAKNEPANVA